MTDLADTPGPVPPEAWREARDAAGMTQEAAAAAIGVTTRAWKYWEAGQRRGPWHALRAFIAVTSGGCQA